jgi:hypothetical protein
MRETFQDLTPTVVKKFTHPFGMDMDTVSGHAKELQRLQ